MRVFFWGAGLFAAVFVLHLGLWRVRIPRAGRRRLFLLFLGALPLTLGLLAALAPASHAVRAAAPRDAGEVLLLAAWYLSLSLAYLALYVALEGDSPTLSIVRLIDDTGSRGLDPAELRRLMTHTGYLRSRLAHLVTDGMAAPDGDRYRITAKGTRLLGYYDTYERLAGLQHDRTV